jgi:hypothetical protein
MFKQRIHFSCLLSVIKETSPRALLQPMIITRGTKATSLTHQSMSTAARMSRFEVALKKST